MNSPSMPPVSLSRQPSSTLLQPVSSTTGLDTWGWVNHNDKGTWAWSDLIFRSNIASYTAKSVLASATFTMIPMGAAALGITLLPVVETALLIAAIASPILLLVAYRKELLFDISLMYTIYQNRSDDSKDWWDDIDGTFLSAIPMEHQIKSLKTAGVTHVLTMLEDFEKEPGLIKTVTTQQWTDKQIERKQIHAPDFLGVDPASIDEGVKYLREKRTAGGKVLVHCKAGRGRSATIVIADKLAATIEADRSLVAGGEDSIKALLTVEITAVKAKRPQINLNANQQATIVKYIQEYVVNKNS